MQVVHVLARGATAPIRLGLSAGGLGLSVARAVLDEARRAVTGETSRSDGWIPPRAPSPRPAIRGRARDGGRPSADAAPAPSAPRPAAVPSPAPEAVDPPPAVPPAAAEGPAVPAVPPPGAKQVDDDPVPVGEFAEAGAEDGAGAEVRVDPPWDGYDAMTAADIRDRLAAADAGLATAVVLYEGARRGRVSVVRAAERRLGALAG